MTSETFVQALQKRGSVFQTISIQAAALQVLKFSLALVFFWFGVLKIADVSPVAALLQKSFPFFAQQPLLGILGFGEILLAFGLVVNKFSRFFAGLMILHLLGTLSVAAVSPQIFFAPNFPILTMEGEFIVKNIVFISAALVLISDNLSASKIKLGEVIKNRRVEKQTVQTVEQSAVSG